VTALGKAQRREPGDPSACSVLVVDDHPMMRRALTDILAEEADFSVCAEAADAASAVAQTRRRQPAAAIVDLRMEGGHGLETISRLCDIQPGLAVLVYSMLEEEQYAERVIAAGALGFLNKRATAEEILEALRTVLTGNVHLSVKATTRMMRPDIANEKPASDSAPAALTQRELAVFESLGQGLTVIQIAEYLSISPKTVDAHRQRIKRKLEAHDNAHLMRMAFEWLNNRS